MELNSPKDYVDSLPENRKKEFGKVRAFIRKSLPRGYKEFIQYKMISYSVPLKADGSEQVSLSLACQSQYMAMYFSHIYKNSKGEKEFRALYQKGGHKLNMGKSCLRFRSFDELNIKFLEKLLAGKFKTPF